MGLKSVIRDATWHIAPKAMHARMLRNGLHHSEIEEQVVEAILNRDRIAIDVGANIGRYTAIFQRCCDKVIAFEPNPTISGVLERAGYGNVQIMRKALSSRADMATLNVPIDAGADGAEKTTLGSLETAEGDGPCATHQIETMTLDAYADDPVGFVKIDVEGHEFDVVQGAQRLIETAKPDFLIEAEDRHRPGTIAQLRQFFTDRGYRCFYITDGRTHDGDSFNAALQDPDALSVQSLPRHARSYVNNFFFVPGQTREAELRKIIDAKLAGLG